MGQVNGFGMKCIGNAYGMSDHGEVRSTIVLCHIGMDEVYEDYQMKTFHPLRSCWVECFVRGDDSYGYGFALWSPFGYTDGDVIKNGRKIPMIREITRGCTVSFKVTPIMNGKEVAIDEGSIQFMLKGGEGVQVEASSSDGQIEVTAEQMDIPVGRYSWAVRWVRSGSVHMLGAGRLDVVKNIFMED